MELKKLKDGEAEIFIRTSDKVLVLKLPAKLVKDLERLKETMKAEDILEVLVKSAKAMTSTLNTLNEGDYKYENGRRK